MQKGKWRKILALLLCVANILGQTVPAMAQEVIPAVVEQGFESTSDVSDNETVLNVQNPSGNDMEDEIKEEGSILAEEGMVSDNTALEETEEVVTPTITVQAEEESTPVNIARGKPTVASSQEAETVRASFAVDGNTSDRNSRWGSGVGAGPHWIYVDLEAEKNVKSVRIYWENRKATEYKIQVASSLSATMQESDWKTVKTLARPAETTDIINFENVEKARYVRLLITSFTKEDPDGGVEWNSVSIYEMEVYEEELEIVQDPSVNVARGKNAYADSVEANSSFTASKAVDGDAGGDSRWAGAYGTGSPRWIYVDLGRVMDVKTVRIYWETRKAKVYSIQLANELSDPMVNEDWTSVKTMNDHPASTKDTIDLGEVKRARYVRLYIDEFTSEDPGGAVTYPIISVYEMEVYGGDPPVNIMELISFVQPQKGDKKLQLVLPEIEGKTIVFNGADYEELVDDNLNIFEPIVDTVVTVNVKISDNEDPKDYQFKEMAITIPGKYSVEEGDNPAPKVLPELTEWKGRQGNYVITDTTRVVYKEEIFKAAAEALAKDYESLKGKVLPVVQADQAEEGDIFFSQTSGKGLLKEGYLMDIGSKITIEAEEYTGAYWATRTILQSIKADGYVPQGITRDYPLYEVRSFILDVGRKTFTMDYLKQIVQEMAWYKMNDFHVHLNDNFIFLEKYTNAGLNPLTAYSGFRLESSIKKGGNNGLNQADLTSKDVFYTKDEFRDFIQESRNYGMNIVPEIDTPAHSLALTKVRPDLRHGESGRNNDHLNLVGKYSESLSFVQSIFDEYMATNLTNPVFDEDTIVHIGCDEYHAGPRAFRQFSNDMIDYVQEKNRTVRMWGSLSSIKESGVPDSEQLAVKSENVQMNLWNFDYANWDEMYEQGFDLITCNDGGYYIVPNAGYYGDYLGDDTMYKNPINSRSGVTIPAGDDQMLGAGIAVWNDMIDILDNGVSEYDVYDRIKLPFALFGANLWGKDPREGKALTLTQAKERYAILGGAPGNNFGYEVESTDGIIAHYPMDNAEEEGLSTAVNSKIASVDGKNALKLNGKESYIKTDFTTVGLNNSLRVKVKRTSASNQEQILFESPYGSIKAVQTGTGRVGFSRENFDYSFNYTLPVDEWVELEFKNQFKTISLYVNGKFVDALGDGEKVANNDGKLMPLLATMMFPVEKIGSATKAFIGYVDDVRLGVNATYNSTMELDYALELVDELSAGTANGAFTALVAEAKTVINTFAPQESVITDLVTRITTELDKLETEKADYSKVNIYLSIIPTDLTVFTEESLAVLNQVKESIRMDLPASMQSVVDGYERVLLKALQGLVVLEKPNVNYIPRTAIEKLEASSSSGEDIDRAFDGKNDTIWHSKYTNNQPDPGPPHWITIQLKDDQVYQISGLVYVPRSGAGNGTFTGYKIQSSSNGTTFTDLKSGNWDRNDQAKTVLFDTPVTDKYIRLESVTSVGDFGSAAEIKLLVAGITPDRDGLNGLFTEARAIQDSEDLSFTNESWNKLQTEIASAISLLESQNLDANDVEIMKGTLSAAMVNLRLRSTPGETPEIAGPFYPVVVMTGDTTAELSFEAATGSENLVYKIVVTKKKNSSTVFETTTTETTVTLENISDTEAYIVNVTATDADGNEGYPAITVFGAPTSEGEQDAPDGIWVEGVEELTYTGTKQTLNLNVYDGVKKLTEGKDYTISFKNNQNAYALSEHPETEYAKKAPQAVIKMKGDYKGTQNIYFDILRKDLNDESITADAVSKTTEKNAKEPVPVVYWNGKALKVNKDFKVTYNYGEDGSASKAGNYTITLTGINNFRGEKEEVPYIVTESPDSLSKATVTIDKSLKGKAVAWDKDGAKIPAGMLTVKVKGNTLNPETDYVVKYANNKAVGTAYVIVEGNPQAGYSGSKRVAFKVTGTAMKDVEVVGMPNPAEFPYEGTAVEPMEMDDVKVMLGDKELVAGTDFTVTYKNNAKQGKATMTLTGNAAAGFTGNKTVTFKITKGKLDASMLKLVGTTEITAETEEITVPFTQGGTKPAVEVKTADGRELVLGTDYTVSYKNNTKVFGEKNSKLAEIKITGKGNYEGTITRNFKIVPKDAASGELSVVVADKVVSTAKKDGWKSTFKVVDISGKALTANKDYSKNAEYTVISSDSEAFPAGYQIQPQDSVPVGTKIKVKVTLTGDNFTGAVEGEYTILAKNYDISKATIKIAAKNYMGAPVTLTNDDITIKIKNNSATLVKDQDYRIVSYTNNVKKGTAKVTLQGIGDFGGTKTVTFKIVQRDLESNWKGVVDFFTNLF